MKKLVCAGCGAALRVPNKVVDAECEYCKVVTRVDDSKLDEPEPTVNVINIINTSSENETTLPLPEPEVPVCADEYQKVRRKKILNRYLVGIGFAGMIVLGGLLILWGVVWS